MRQHTDSDFSAVESSIRATGARVTPLRVRILHLLRSAHGPFSHSELEEALFKDGYTNVDRVTLYRVLDWLAHAGLALKAVDRRGVFRFTVAKPDVEHAEHIHFRCTSCGGVFCLDTPPPPPPVLPSGFHLAALELDIRGECPGCVRMSP